jgi:hypothetical protein
METLAVCVTVLVLWASARPLLERWLDARTATPTAVEELVVPDDLVRIARRESETWAQESVIRSMREAYKQESGEPLERWEKVRMQFRISQMGA